MAKTPEQQMNDIMNGNPQDVLDEATLGNVKDALDMDSITETIEKFDDSPSTTSRVEDWQFSSLMLEKILNDEKYEAERKKYFEEIARRSNLDLTEGADNPQSRFETAFNQMTGLKKKTLEKIAPIAYSDLQAELDEMISIQRSRKMLLDAGVKMQDPAIRDEMAESNRVAYAFHQKLGDPNVDFEGALKREAPAINKAFEALSADKAKKFGMLAVMTAATGGSNLVVKGGMFALKSIAANERLQNTLSKGWNGLSSFLQEKGVNTKPLENAMASIKEKEQKAREKLLGTKWGMALAGATAFAAYVGYGVATGDIDLEAIGQKGIDLYNDVMDGKEPASYGFDGRSATAGFEGEGSVQPENYNVKENADWAQEQMNDYYDDEISFDDVVNGLNDQQLEKLGEFAQPSWDAKLVELYGDNIPETVPKTMPPEMVQLMAQNIAGEAVANGAMPSDTIMEHISKLEAEAIENSQVTVQGPFQETFDSPNAQSGDYMDPRDNIAQSAQDAVQPESNGYMDPRDNIAQSARDAADAAQPSGGEYMDPRDNIAQSAREAAEAAIADVNSDIVINEIQAGTTSLTVESGSSVYETVKAHLTEVNGMPPSEQAIMQATSDIIAESGIDDPSKVPAGFEFDFRAENYAYVESVSQETVDIARFGADGIPDGLKGQTLGEIANGRFDGLGPVETRTTGQLMTEGAINGAVKADIVNSIDKGLDPNMTIDDWIATMETKVSALDGDVPPVNLESKSNLAASITSAKMDSVQVPDGHAAPTANAGNEKAFEQYHERQQKYRSDMGLGQ